MAGLAHLGELLCGVHYICPDIGRLALTDELTAMINQSASIPNIARSLIFAGESYQIILEELEAVHPDSDSKLIDYGEAYRSVQLPVYLLPCDNTGAMQLQIMSVPDYRHRCTMAALRAQYEPPPEAFDQWDAMFQGTTFVMAADMDLRRLDAVLSAAHQAGYKRVSIAALPAQAEEVFYPRYRDTGKAKCELLNNHSNITMRVVQFPHIRLLHCKSLPELRPTADLLSPSRSLRCQNTMGVQAACGAAIAIQEVCACISQTLKHPLLPQLWIVMGRLP